MNLRKDHYRFLVLRRRKPLRTVSIVRGGTDVSQMGLDPAPHVFIFVYISNHNYSPALFDRAFDRENNTVTTSNGESLGSCLDDERSQLR